MNTPSLIFWIIFAVPLFVFLVWLMRQDKKKGKWGLGVMVIILVVIAFYMFKVGKLLG